MGVCIHLIARMGMHTPRAEARRRMLCARNLSEGRSEGICRTHKTEAM